MKKGKRIVLVMIALVSAVSLFAAPLMVGQQFGYAGTTDSRFTDLEKNDDGTYVAPISEAEAEKLEAAIENYQVTYDAAGNRVAAISDEDLDALRLYYQVERYNESVTNGSQFGYGSARMSSTRNGAQLQLQSCDEDCTGDCTPNFLSNQRNGNYNQKTTSNTRQYIGTRNYSQNQRGGFGR